MQGLKEKKEQAVWIARSLFERGKTSGTTANISFRDGDSLWISRSGSCFGLLTEDDFVECSLSGAPLDADKKPSKEAPLHAVMYGIGEEIQAVIHTHSPYAVIWSCLDSCSGRDVIPRYTPYLDMKAGKVAAMPYAPPGSPELFGLMREYAGSERAYLLANHGPIVGGLSLMNAFEAIEELEQSAFLAWNFAEYEKITGREGRSI